MIADAVLQYTCDECLGTSHCAHPSGFVTNPAITARLSNRDASTETPKCRPPWQACLAVNQYWHASSATFALDLSSSHLFFEPLNNDLVNLMGGRCPIRTPSDALAVCFC